MRFQTGHTTNVTHGHSRGKESPEYRCWQDMKGRCHNPDHKFFKYYGGRGISVCDRWRNDFSAFIADMGNRPTPKHTIDRFPDNNGNYEPENVRWATRRQQVDNRRTTRTVMLQGERISIAEACRRLGLNYKTVSGRIDHGWKPEAAITPSLWKGWRGR